DAISYNKYRKPFLTNYPKIFFNFSHCQNGVCCAISDYGSIGVDFQNIVSISKDAMKEVLTDNEISYIENSHNVNRNFIKLWTLKECYLKYLGTGFFENPKNIEFINDSLNFKKDNLFFKSIFFNDSFISCCSLTECNFKLVNYNDIVSTITNRRCVYDKKVYSGGFWKVGCKDS
ncbi:MAG: 4'-phosphopantetheinyl transferase superfamily protein, partial [Ruminococcus sp.]|nr:4'-phosphopantetheinyl transferase superfamily protein [Ruminococcus sp.]